MEVCTENIYISTSIRLSKSWSCNYHHILGFLNNYSCITFFPNSLLLVQLVQVYHGLKEYEIFNLVLTFILKCFNSFEKSIKYGDT